MRRGSSCWRVQPVLCRRVDRVTLRVTMEVEAPTGADVQGLKEKIAMYFEKYGDVRVVKVERVGVAEQYEQQRIE